MLYLMFVARTMAWMGCVACASTQTPGGADKNAQGIDLPPSAGGYTQGASQDPMPQNVQPPHAQSIDGGPASSQTNAGLVTSPGSTRSPQTGDAQGSSGQITREELENAVLSAGYPPNPQYLDVVLEQTNRSIPNKDQAAMFVAQLIYESEGLNYIEEQACVGAGSCEGLYGTGAPGKNYHGRGFIQISWPENYLAASESLGLGSLLYDDPDAVVRDPNVAMQVSVWYWQNVVANEPGVEQLQFGATTRAINGPIECSGLGSSVPEERYAIYLGVANALRVQNIASEAGC